MTRFLIFACLFPGIVIAVLIAMIGGVPDASAALQLVGWTYAVGVVPVLICVAVHRLLRKTRIPPVIGTGLAGAAMAALVFPLISDNSDFGLVLSFGLMPLAAVLMPIESATVALSLTFGLVVGILAALCSWLAGGAGHELTREAVA